MKYFIPALLCLTLAAGIAAPAKACVTRSLKAPEAVAAYLKEKQPQTGDARALLAEAFKRDKAYYDATVLDFCSLSEHANAAAQAAMSDADHKIMDVLIDKWQKIADAAKANAPAGK